MLRSFTAFLLIFTVLTANFSRVYMYAAYELNKSYIASTLCENRDKPQLHCNGKCFFMKKVKQAAEKEKRNERESQKNLIQEAFVNRAVTIRFSSQLLQVFNAPELPIVLPLHSASIFQPPRA
jgi:hypothetical protein